MERTPPSTAETLSNAKTLIEQCMMQCKENIDFILLSQLTSTLFPLLLNQCLLSRSLFEINATI